METGSLLREKGAVGVAGVQPGLGAPESSILGSFRDGGKSGNNLHFQKVKKKKLNNPAEYEQIKAIAAPLQIFFT